MAARSLASRSSFFTLRLPQLLPSGCARCTFAPSSLSTSAGPIPPIGGLEHNLGCFSCLRHRLGELEWLARDAVTAEHLSVLGHPIDRRAAAVQINFRRTVAPVQGPPLSRVGCRTPSITRLGSTGGAEAPLLHRISYRLPLDRPVGQGVDGTPSRTWRAVLPGLTGSRS